MEFEKYYNQDPAPLMPEKPRFPAAATPQDFRSHADRLEEYDKQMAVFEQEMEIWREKKNKCRLAFKADLLNEFDLTDHPKADEIYAYVYDQADGDIEDTYYKLDGIIHLFR